MNKVKAFLTRVSGKAKYLASAMAVGCTAALATVVSSAEETGTQLADYSDQIIGQFSGAVDSIVPIVVGVMGAGLGIFVIFVGIKLGKKMFNTVSK